MERGGIAALRVLERCMTSPLMRESMRSIGVRFIREDRDGGATEEMIERTIVSPLPAAYFISCQSLRCSPECRVVRLGETHLCPHL